MTELTRAQVARMIDHTLLKPEASDEQVAQLVGEAAELGCYSVCVSPNKVPLEVPAEVKLAVVCGFPSGAHDPQVKAEEARIAAAAGVDEIDMVIDVAAARAGNVDHTEREIRAVREAARGVVLKVIIESAALEDDQIIACCQAAERAGADFVKTSTGFHSAGGASVHAVELMARTVGGRLGVKASGGIRDAETAAAMIAAGATRLGLSSSAEVLDGLPS